MSEQQEQINEQTNNEQQEKKEEKVSFFQKVKQKKAEFGKKHPKIAKVMTFTLGAGIGVLGTKAFDAIINGVTHSSEDAIDVSYIDVTDNDK